MKKNLFKTLFIATGATLILSSCLGDTESSSSASNVFAYISGTGTSKIARANFDPLTSSELQSSYLENGDCVFIGYKFSPNNVEGNAYRADYIQIPEDTEENRNKIFKARNQIIPSTATVDTTTVHGDLYFTRFPSSSSLSGNLITMNFPDYAYRWYIAYDYEKKESEAPALLALYYDASPGSQVDRENNPLPEGEVVIDFRLERQGSGTPNESEKTVTAAGYQVINFSFMKAQLQNKAKDKILYIRFRYFTKKPSVKEGESLYRLNTTEPITGIDYSIENK